MYICSCFAVTDHQIRDAVKEGDVPNFRGLCKKLKCCTNCGICAKSAKAIFDAARAKKRQEDEADSKSK